MNNEHDNEDSLPTATRRSGRQSETQRTHSVHPTRAQDEYAEKIAHEAAPIPWDSTTNTFTPPARPGMKQRWIRVEETAGVSDARNVTKKALEGWTPRPADSVPEAYRPQTVNKGQFAGCICVGDLVLMERPIELHERYAKVNRAKVARLEQAVKSDLHRVERPGAPIQYGERTTAKTGEGSSND